MFNIEVGIKIRELREKSKWSQAELGRKINKSKSTISLYESGAKIPPGDVLIEMATLFNVSLDYLVGIDKNEMVSINHLSAKQKSLIHTLLVELRDPTKAPGGLSPRQQDILSIIMQEFANKNMRS